MNPLLFARQSRNALIRWLRGHSLAALVLVTLCNPGFCAHHSVTSLEDSGPGSLREALTLAQDDADAAIDLSGLRGSLLITSPLPAISTQIQMVGPGPDLLSIDAAYRARHFLISGAGRLSLISLRLTRGSPPGNESGGSIHNGGSLNVSNCLFAVNGCVGGFGGAIYSAGALSVDNSIFESNVVCGGEPNALLMTNQQGGSFTASGGCGAGMGGAVFIEGGKASISASRFISNRAKGGESSSSGCIGRSLSTNASPGRGGGPYGGAVLEPGGFGSGGGWQSDGGFGGGSGRLIWCSPYAEVCQIVGEGPGEGFAGALFVKSGDVEVEGCRFEGNRVLGGAYTSSTSLSTRSAYGGAVFQYGGTLNVTKTVFLANTSVGINITGWRGAGSHARGFGGAIQLLGGILNLESSSLVSNVITAPAPLSGWGSALSVGGGSAHLLNCTVSQNQILGGDVHPSSDGSGGFQPGYGTGAAITVTNGLLRLEHCTVVNNVGHSGDVIPHYQCGFERHPSTPEPGGFISKGGRLVLRACLIAGNGIYPGYCPSHIQQQPAFVPMEGSGLVESLGYNFIEVTDEIEGLHPLDITGLRPMLAPFQTGPNGIPTVALVRGAIGVNSVPREDLPTVDQLGVARPQGPFGDVGAIENSGDLMQHPPFILGGYPVVTFSPWETVRLVSHTWSLPPVHYQWYRNGTLLPSATNGLLTLSPFRVEEEGDYTVTVSNSAGAINAGSFPLRFSRNGSADFDWVHFAQPGFSTTLVIDKITGNLETLGLPGARFQDAAHPILPNHSNHWSLVRITPAGVRIPSPPLVMKTNADSTLSLLKVNGDQRILHSSTPSGNGSRIAAYEWHDGDSEPIWLMDLFNPPSHGAQLVRDGDGYALVVMGQSPGTGHQHSIFSADLSSHLAIKTPDSASLMRIVDTNQFVFTGAYPTSGKLVLQSLDAQGVLKWAASLTNIQGAYSGDVRVTFAESSRGIDCYLVAETVDVPTPGGVITNEVPRLLTARRICAFLVRWDINGRFKDVQLVKDGGLELRDMRSDKSGTFLVFGGFYSPPAKPPLGDTLPDIFGNDQSRSGLQCIGVAKFSVDGHLEWSLLRRSIDTVYSRIHPDGFGGCYLSGSVEVDETYPRDWEFGSHLPLPSPPVGPRPPIYSFLARVSSPLQFRASVIPQSGSILVSLWGEMGLAYEVEESGNLKEWQTVRRIHLTDSRVAQIPVPQPSEQEHLFYRVRRIAVQ